MVVVWESRDSLQARRGYLIFIVAIAIATNLFAIQTLVLVLIMAAIPLFIVTGQLLISLRFSLKKCYP